jgi:hypothetical protein
MQVVDTEFGRKWFPVSLAKHKTLPQMLLPVLLGETIILSTGGSLSWSVVAAA